MNHVAAPLDPMTLHSEAAGVGSAGRTDRVQPRGKPALEDKLKKPVDSGRKKPPPARKAPARGRYVDEYARPAV